jgi:predicted aldo/keto reductase-like oxidoreductase
MIYKNFRNIRLSALGMGNMRLPTVGGDPEAAIDYEKAQEIIDYAMAHGINYYDTAYVYHKGESEVFLGKALAKYPRDSFCLATKFYVEANPDFKAVFEEQLSRLQTEYIDFYLIHGVMDHNTERNIPIVIMEPIRGGRLAALTEELSSRLKAAQPGRTAASWALRWLKRFGDIQVVLSGMSSMEQIKDNVAVFETEEALDEKQAAFLEEIGRDYKAGFTIPCTECRYCCDECPQEIDIPHLLSIYNNFKYIGWWIYGNLSDIPAEKSPSACIVCGACLKHCPQSIAIPEIMNEMAALAAKG